MKKFFAPLLAAATLLMMAAMITTSIMYSHKLEHDLAVVEQESFVKLPGAEQVKMLEYYACLEAVEDVLSLRMCSVPENMLLSFLDSHNKIHVYKMCLDEASGTDEESWCNKNFGLKAIRASQ